MKMQLKPKFHYADIPVTSVVCRGQVGIEEFGLYGVYYSPPHGALLFVCLSRPSLGDIHCLKITQFASFNIFCCNEIWWPT